MTDFQLTHPTYVGGRASNDHYPTPRWCTLALLKAIDLPPGALVFDPSCGEGSLLSVFSERGHPTSGIELDEARGLDAQKLGHDVVVGDSLKLPWCAEYIIGNPPYSVAEDFVWKALENPQVRLVAFLLRLSFLEPVNGRGTVFEIYPPNVYILPRRPSFDGKGSDNITSAWFVWPGGNHLSWLPR